MSENIKYVCPFRKEVWGYNPYESKEYFMPCDFEKCSLCSVGETSDSKSYFCEYPNYQKGWLIKREVKNKEKINE